MRSTDPKKLSFGLGVFSIALGAAELFGTRKIARALGQDDRVGRRTLRVFGAREMVAGAGLLAAPARATLMWSRVAGDAMDLAALGLAARRASGRPALWGAVAFVAGATLLDTLVARALDRRTGKASPARKTPSAPPSLPADAPAVHHATTIEPEGARLVRAPEVPG